MENIQTLLTFQKSLGPARLAAMLDPRNLEKVLSFSDSLLGHHASGVTLPSILTIGDRGYRIVTILPESEMPIGDRLIFHGAVGIEEEGQYILAHEDQIPQTFRDRVVFLFASKNKIGVSCVSWCGIRWALESNFHREHFNDLILVVLCLNP